MTDCPPTEVIDFTEDDEKYREGYVDLGKKICDKSGQCLATIRRVKTYGKYPEFMITCKRKR